MCKSYPAVFIIQTSYFYNFVVRNTLVTPFFNPLNIFFIVINKKKERIQCHFILNDEKHFTVKIDSFVLECIHSPLSSASWTKLIFTFNSETFIFIRDWYSSAPTRNFNIVYYILMVRNPSDRNHECRWPLVERCFPAFFFFFSCLCVYFKRYKPFSETNDKSQQYIL